MHANNFQHSTTNFFFVFLFVSVVAFFSLLFLSGNGFIQCVCVCFGFYLGSILFLVGSSFLSSFVVIGLAVFFLVKRYFVFFFGLLCRVSSAQSLSSTSWLFDTERKKKGVEMSGLTWFGAHGDITRTRETNSRFFPLSISPFSLCYF